MDRQGIFIIVLGICIANGIFSPLLNVALPITAVLLPEVFPKTVNWVLFFSSILVASATLLFAGVPAALYERLVAPAPGGTGPMYVWLAGTILISVPALQTLDRL